MRRRALLFIVGFGLVSLVCALSILRSRTPSPASTLEKANDADSVQDVTASSRSRTSDIDQLNDLLRSDPAEALALLAKMEEEQRHKPPLEPPEIAALTAEEKALFLAEIEALTPVFQKLEKEASSVVFDGQRKESTIRTVRISAANQWQLDQMAAAYSSILGKYREDSKLHTALWIRISEMVSDLSRERLFTFQGSEGSKGFAIVESRSPTASGIDEGIAAGNGIPDAEGRITFRGPCKIVLFDGEDSEGTRSASSNKAKNSSRYNHLLSP